MSSACDQYGSSAVVQAYGSAAAKVQAAIHACQHSDGIGSLPYTGFNLTWAIASACVALVLGGWLWLSGTGRFR